MRENIGFIVKSLNNQIRRLMERTSLEENNANLTGMQYAMLGFSCNKSQTCDVYQRDIESKFNIRRSSASEALKSLEALGYIRRESVPDDARLKKIIPTEKGKQLQAIARRHMDELQARLIKGIAPEELEICYKVLAKISENAND